MANEHVKPTTIPGLYTLSRPTFTDERGFFREVLHMDELETALGVPFRPVQLNHSVSQPGVIRGFHADNWQKLVYPATGETFAAIVDIRPDSPTFGSHESFLINDANRIALFLSVGLANSICVSGTEAVSYLYLVDAYFDNSTRAIAWNDPDINVQWPVADPIVSERDQKNPSFRDLFPEKFPRP